MFKAGYKSNDFGSVEYWENRYIHAGKKDYHDWYYTYEDIGRILQGYIESKEDNILILGCGTSLFGEHFADEGYKNVTAIDFSPTAIRNMTMQNKITKVKYIEMDATDMKDFDDNQFDFILDKALFDSVICGYSCSENANKLLSEVYRVLKPGGNYFMFSNGPPPTRLPYLLDAGLKWDVSTVRIGNHIYCYPYKIRKDSKEPLQQ